MPHTQTGSTNAIEMLKQDHKKVKAIFKKFEDTEEPDQMKQLVEQAIQELKVHAAIEEEVFYPAVRQEAEDQEDTVDEALEEHHVVKLLIEELEGMEPGDERYKAKFTVLSENVKHHIEEEESEMLPEAEKAGLDLEGIGAEMAARKQELLAEYAGETNAAPDIRDDSRNQARAAQSRPAKKGPRSKKG